ncbi:MAG: glycosyltransferase, partial [Thermoleophilaceae bacterium]
MGLLFYPRGGSAQVALYLAAALAKAGWHTELICGSLGQEGERSNAATFFGDLEVHAAHYDPALAAAAAGRDPIAADFPLHPSFEDRLDAPDRVFAAVSPELAETLAQAWTELVASSLGADVDLFHLHHLSPLQEAFARVRPDVPIVTHLHGTELKMIELAERLRGIAAQLGLTLAELADRADARQLPGLSGLAPEDLALASTTRWARWRHADYWVQCMRLWAARSDRLLVISPNDMDEVSRLLLLDGTRATCIPNGVDLTVFAPEPVPPDLRLRNWRRWLVEEPQGWAEGAQAGTIAYSEADLARFEPGSNGESNPVLMFVGRFTEVKRIPLLLRAFALAREQFVTPAPLVIWGGFPGEW